MNTFRPLWASDAPDQTVYTPAKILDVVRSIWPITFDPCPGPPGGNIVLTAAGRLAKRDGVLPTSEDMQVDDGFARPVQSLVGAVDSTPHGLDGRNVTWPDGTYVNPPFGELWSWLVTSLAQHCDHIMLVPVRSHRPWWRQWARACEVVYLDPIKFEGHTNAFPAPLCLARRGFRMREAGRLRAACEAAGIGEGI